MCGRDQETSPSRAGPRLTCCRRPGARGESIVCVCVVEMNSKKVLHTHPGARACLSLPPASPPTPPTPPTHAHPHPCPPTHTPHYNKQHPHVTKNKDPTSHSWASFAQAAARFLEVKDPTSVDATATPTASASTTATASAVSPATDRPGTASPGAAPAAGALDAASPARRDRMLASAVLRLGASGLRPRLADTAGAAAPAPAPAFWADAAVVTGWGGGTARGPATVPWVALGTVLPKETLAEEAVKPDLAAGAAFAAFFGAGAAALGFGATKGLAAFVAAAGAGAFFAVNPFTPLVLADVKVLRTSPWPAAAGALAAARAGWAGAPRRRAAAMATAAMAGLCVCAVGGGWGDV